MNPLTILAPETKPDRAERLNQFLAAIRKRLKALDDGGDLAARTHEEWLAVAERVTQADARGLSAEQLRERAVTFVAAIFLATDSE